MTWEFQYRYSALGTVFLRGMLHLGVALIGLAVVGTLWAPSAALFALFGLFLTGLALVGAGLRPRGSAGLGIALTAGLYLFLGLCWMLAAAASSGTDVSRAIALAPWPFLREAFLEWVLIWPLRMWQFVASGFRFVGH